MVTVVNQIHVYITYTGIDIYAFMHYMPNAFCAIILANQT